MTLRASLLRELEKPSLSVERRIEIAKELEYKGEYEQARQGLSGLWPGIGERPDTEGLDSSTTAELLMRAGVLTGIIGSKSQFAEAHETAKNLLTESLAIFEAIPYPKKIAEALITHGRALARLSSYRASLDSFRRAIVLAGDTGSFKRVADAAVAAFEELGEHLITSEGQDIASGLTFTEAKELLEHDFIKRALELYHGSITHAARSLGISHQALDYMLHTRHRDLLEKRRPERQGSKRK